MSDPVIAAVIPSSGPPGTLVSINGSGFSEVTGVAIGGVPASVLSQTDSTLMVSAPAAATGADTITLAAAGALVIAGAFAVTTPIGPAPQSPNYTPILVGGLVIAGATLVLAMREHSERDADRAAARR